MEAFAKAEKTPKPNWKEMFTDVYDDVPQHLQYVNGFITLCTIRRSSGGG